jgi:hypothetical protein
MSIPNARPTAAAPSSSATGRPQDSYVDQLWSALRLDDPLPRTPAHGLPMPRLGTPEEESHSMYYAVTAIDVWGRLADRSALTALRWRPGLAVAVSIIREAVAVIPHHDSRHTVNQQGHLRLPATVRHLSRLKAGDRLLLAACLDRDVLIAYPMAALDAMVLAYHTMPAERTAQ